LVKMVKVNQKTNKKLNQFGQNGESKSKN